MKIFTYKIAKCNADNKQLKAHIPLKQKKGKRVGRTTSDFEINDTATIVGWMEKVVSAKGLKNKQCNSKCIQT